jgi:hypothetical protein
MKQRRGRKQKKGEPQRITKAVTYIRLSEANSSKLAALDALALVYLALCQQYVTLFCAQEKPNKLRAPLFATSLSERWHRVAIQQAAGMAKSWRTNREQAYADYLEEREEYCEKQAEGALAPKDQEPVWQEWNVPSLKQTCIQANANVIKLETSEESTFDYWLIISTLEFRKPLFVPVKLAEYHREVLKGETLNSSVQLNRREDGWWLTLSYDKMITIPDEPQAPVISIDVGIANFLTTSDGKHYGTFNGKLRRRHKRDREKRRRKAKLRKCLEKKGVEKEKLPFTSSATGQRLTRHVRQEINRAVNQCFEAHPDIQFSYEHLSVATMKFKARAMNAYLYASNLGHIPKQIEWNATKRGASNEGQECLLLNGRSSTLKCGQVSFVHIFSNYTLLQDRENCSFTVKLQSLCSEGEKKIWHYSRRTCPAHRISNLTCLLMVACFLNNMSPRPCHVSSTHGI